MNVKANPRRAGRKPPSIPTRSRNFRLNDIEFAALRAAGGGEDATLGLRRLIYDEAGVRQAIRDAMGLKHDTKVK